MFVYTIVRNYENSVLKINNMLKINRIREKNFVLINFY